MIQLYEEGKKSLFRTACSQHSNYFRIKEGLLNKIAYINRLEEKRQDLKHAIHREMRTPHFDEVKVHNLKKDNLRLKDEISDLRQKAS